MPAEVLNDERELSTWKRVDIYAMKSLEICKNDVWICRLGSTRANGEVLFRLEEANVPYITACASLIWTDYYLSKDLTHLELNSIRKNQVVVHVDWENRKAIRGSYLGRRKADGRHMLLCLDIGECKIVTKDSLYATTELAAKTELKGFVAMLDNVGLFRKSRHFVTAMDTYNSLHRGIDSKMTRGSLCKVTVKGFVKGREIVPIVDVVRIVHDIVNLNPPPSYNMELAKYCISLWTKELERPYMQTFTGVVAYVNADALISIHLLGDLGETLALYMEHYLLNFRISDLQKRFLPLTLNEAREGYTSGRIYIAQFPEDYLLYRAKILDADEDGAYVEFIDYGNSAFVTYDKIFDARKIDEVLDFVPQLIWPAYLCGINKITNVDRANELFQGETEFKFTVRDGMRNGLPLVSVTRIGTEDGERHNLIAQLVRENIAVPSFRIKLKA